MKPLSLSDFLYYRDCLCQSKSQEEIFDRAVECSNAYWENKSQENIPPYANCLEELLKSLIFYGYEPINIEKYRDLGDVIVAVVEMQRDINNCTDEYVIVRQNAYNYATK